MFIMEADVYYYSSYNNKKEISGEVKQFHSPKRFLVNNMQDIIRGCGSPCNKPTHTICTHMHTHNLTNSFAPHRNPHIS